MKKRKWKSKDKKKIEKRVQDTSNTFLQGEKVRAFKHILLNSLGKIEEMIILD